MQTHFVVEALNSENKWILASSGQNEEAAMRTMEALRANAANFTTRIRNTKTGQITCTHKPREDTPEIER